MTTSLSTKPLRQVSNVKELLWNAGAHEQLSMVATKFMSPERIMRLMANAIRTTPKLEECDPMSLLGALMTCTRLGLEPNTTLGHAYLIPFKNKRKGISEVNLIIGYKGMIEILYRSGKIKSIHADVVYEGDIFEFEYGSNQLLRHVPVGPREKPTHAYCHAKLIDGEVFVVLPYDEVLKTRDGSQGYKAAIQYNKKDHPWIKHEHAMAKKTPVRAIFNELPVSIETLSDALSADGGHADFSGFAANPEGGLNLLPDENDIEGNAKEAESEDQKKAEPEPTKVNTKAKPKGKDKPKTKPVAEPTIDEADEVAHEKDIPTRDEANSGLVKLILGEIAEVSSEAELDTINELYSDQIETLSGVDLKVIEDAALVRVKGFSK